MAQNKTQQNDASVQEYLAKIDDAGRRQDCEDLARLMSKVSKQPAKMWGSAIVGFGSYQYRYDSGREGESCLVGFSSRKGDISVYLAGDFPGRDDLLARLGRHKTAKACLYLRKLSDVDQSVLEQLVAASVAERQRRHS